MPTCATCRYISNPWYQRWAPGPLPHAEQFYAGAITLPLFPCLQIEQLDMVKNVLLNYFQNKNRPWMNKMLFISIL